MKIDTSGLSCPEPVLRVKKVLKDEPSSIEIVVDNNTALQNVQRYLRSQNYQVESHDFVIKGRK